MHMLFLSLRRAPALIAALLVALAVSGCAFKNPFASKNPLIDDEPAPQASVRTETAPASKEVVPVKSEAVPVQAAAEPVKPVLPRPVLVVKPGKKAKPSEAKPSEATPQSVNPPAPASVTEPKPAALKPAAPATESKPAVIAAPAAAAKPVEVKPSAPAAVAQTARPDAANAATAVPPNVTAPGVVAIPAPALATPAITAATPVLQPTIATISDPGKPAPTGWERWLGFFKPYKINIQQGNFISHDMAAKVRVGMTKEQVRFVLGTPLLTDMFHANRWDYLFRLQKPNGELTANRMAIFFSDNRVERILSSELPSESEYLTHIAGPAEPAKPAPSQAKPSAPTPQPTTQP